jgi:methionyl-tRNA formyltransferase
MNGETETGITTFYIEQKVDVGDVILMRKIPIGPEEDAGDVHDKMCEIGAEALVETLDLIEQNKAKQQRQVGEVTLAPKIKKETCRIDWTKDAVSIFNQVRGLSPFPRAFTIYKGNELKICCARIEPDFSSKGAVPGRIIDVDKKGKIYVTTGNGVISIVELQPECKRRMTTAEFLRGHKIEVGEIFE